MNEMAVTQARVCKSEWIKLRTVRSTLITVAAAFVVAVGIGVLLSALVSRSDGPEARIADPLSLSLGGFGMAQLIVGVLGVVIVAGEYSSGMIRTTFSAVTHRLPVLWAKTVVFAALILVVMTVAAFVSFVGGSAAYKGVMRVPSLGDPGVLRAVLGSAVYCCGVGVLGVALGFIMRSTAAAIGVLFAVLLLIPGLALLLPGEWGDMVVKLLPSNAGQAFMSSETRGGAGGELLSPWVGAGVFSLWIAGLLAGAAVLLRRRDA